MIVLRIYYNTLIIGCDINNILLNILCFIITGIEIFSNCAKNKLHMIYSPPSINGTLINVNSLYLLTKSYSLILLTRMLSMLNVNNNLLPLCYFFTYKC